MEFRYALLNNGVEFGTQETNISRAVGTRRRQLESYWRGEKATMEDQVRWSKILKPYIPKPILSRDSRYDRGCCELYFPRWCHRWWVNPKTLRRYKALRMYDNCSYFDMQRRRRGRGRGGEAGTREDGSDSDQLAYKSVAHSADSMTKGDDVSVQTRRIVLEGSRDFDSAADV
uniref:Uncharacterized protein n=1 Tax=Lygus hesperus TaxID=30085 RepID=A0A146KWP9_LYGHE